MGLYIDPDNMTKEQWLAEHGVPLNGPPPAHKDGTRIAICLVFNPMFTAAAVAYSQQELEDFSRPEDFRPKTWYMVEEAKVREVCGEQVKYYLDRK